MAFHELLLELGTQHDAEVADLHCRLLQLNRQDVATVARVSHAAPRVSYAPVPARTSMHDPGASLLSRHPPRASVLSADDRADDTLPSKSSPRVSFKGQRKQRLEGDWDLAVALSKDSLEDARETSHVVRRLSIQSAPHDAENAAEPDDAMRGEQSDGVQYVEPDLRSEGTQFTPSEANLANMDTRGTSSYSLKYSLHPEWTAPDRTSTHVDEWRAMLCQSPKRTHTGLNDFASDRLRSVIHPRSMFRIFWEFCSICLLCLDVLWLPLQAFSVPDAGMLSVLQVVFWTLDIPCSFVTGFYTDDGKLEMSLRKIAQRYLRTWFSPDVLLVSNDWIAMAFTWLGGNERGFDDNSLAQMARIARLGRNLRCLRLLRLAKLREILMATFKRMSSESSALMLEMGLSAILLIVLNHIVACLWFHLGASKQDSDTWVREYMVDDSSLVTQYTYSLHWSLTQFTPATMEVFPQNTDESIFTVIVIVSAMLTFSSFVSSITSGMTRLRTLKAEQAKQDYMLRSFLRENQIAHDLVMRITRHISMASQREGRTTQMEHVSLLNFLTASLHLDLQKELYSPWLGHHPFFAHYLTMDQEALREFFCAVITFQAFAAEDILFKCQEVASNMYFVRTGHLRYGLPTSRAAGYYQLIQMKDGGWLSEAALWLPWDHRGSADFAQNSQMALLNARHFSLVTIKYPDVHRLAKQRAHEFLDLLRTGRVTTDVEQDEPELGSEAPC